MVWGQPSAVVKAASTIIATQPVPAQQEPTSSTTGNVSKPTGRIPLSFEDDLIDLYDGVELVETIEIEGVALLQMIKHCHESLPNSVTGSLLGLEMEKILEITNSFPSLPKTEIKKKESDEYQMEMMKNLREVGMDNNKVGWYQSIQSSTFCTASFIEYQYQYQRSLGPNAICLIYDPLETIKGHLSIKAYRLKKNFMDTYKTGIYTKEHFIKGDIRSTTILEEISIKIHNADLIQCWLSQISSPHLTFDHLDLATNSYLETRLQNMSVWADELAQEHFKFQGYERNLAKQKIAYQQWQHRQREENKLRLEKGMSLVPEEDDDFFKSVNQPSRLEALLITKQMNTYCEQMNQYAGKSLQKLFLASSIHQKE